MTTAALANRAEEEKNYSSGDPVLRGSALWGNSRHLSAPICHCAFEMTLDETNRRVTNRLTEFPSFVFFFFSLAVCNRTRFRVCCCRRRRRCLCHRQVQEQVEQVAPRMPGRLLPHSSLPSWGSGLAADLLSHAGSTLKRFGCLSTCSLLTWPHSTVRIKPFWLCFVSLRLFFLFFNPGKMHYGNQLNVLAMI